MGVTLIVKNAFGFEKENKQLFKIRALLPEEHLYESHERLRQTAIMLHKKKLITVPA